MFFAKNSVVPFPVNSFDFEKVVCSTGALDMEGNHALRILALNTGAAILATADNTLEAKSFQVDLRHSDRRLRRYDRSWDPISTAEMNPLIQCLCPWNRSFFQSISISLQEESVVLRDLSH